MSSTLFRRGVCSLLLAGGLVTLGGCSSSSWRWNDGNETVSFTVRADPVDGLEFREVGHSLSVAPGETVRIRNLAGNVHIVQGPGADVELSASVHAKGDNLDHTMDLLEGMTWIEGTDDAGRPEWTLSYPTDRYESFHYPVEGHGYWTSSSKMYGRRTKVTTERGPGTPTLFADVTIVAPAGASLSVRNLAGAVESDDLTGDLRVHAAVGSIDLGALSGEVEVTSGSADISIRTAHDGPVDVRAGSGNVDIGDLRAAATLRTGSGEITVDRVESPQLNAKTGSGDVVVRHGAVDDMKVGTGSGDLDLVGIELGAVQARTGSGDITIEGVARDTRSVSASTGSGDVTIIMHDDADFDMEFKTGSGNVRVHGLVDSWVQENGRSRTRVKRGDGATKISIASGSGDCTLRGAPGG